MFHSKQLGLTPAQVSSIGEVAIESAYLEIYIEDIISHLSKVEPEVRVILMERSQFAGKLATLQKLITLRCADENLRKRFKKLFEDISNTESDRNTIIHGQWLTDKRGLRAARLRGAKFTKPISAAGITDIAKRLSRLSVSLEEWYGAYCRGDEVPTSP